MYETETGVNENSCELFRFSRPLKHASTALALSPMETGSVLTPATCMGRYKGIMAIEGIKTNIKNSKLSKILYLSILSHLSPQ